MDGASGAELMLVRSCVCVRARCLLFLRSHRRPPSQKKKKNKSKNNKWTLRFCRSGWHEGGRTDGRTDDGLGGGMFNVLRW